ncbi:hypothetical protein SAMN05216276_1003309 [Streptosporangium subroseum]|uniref:Uncharacterized protein n=1 Tax=Streptosporangium subroseum TaxID=106412 RepID=A0A239BKK7_9ACTN|nr:hypothetical protein SAMN05216276_1003309 [Streptosporangium subroseum]
MIFCPIAVTVDGNAVFTTVKPEADVAATVAVDGADATAGPVGGVPEAVAVFTIEPASISAWVVM